MQWPRGIIRELIPGRDTRNRLVKVDKFNWDGSISQVLLPIQKLYPLEALTDIDKIRFHKQLEKVQIVQNTVDGTETGLPTYWTLTKLTLENHEP